MDPIFTVYNDITGKAVSVFFYGSTWFVPFEFMTFEATSLPLAKTIARHLAAKP